MSVPPKKPDRPSAPPTDSAFIGGGEMGKLARAKDWSRTPLGPIASWPPSLRTAVSLVLNSNFPISLAWGPQHIQIYNDGYMPMIAGKHPGLLGEDFRVSWASVWEVVGADFERAWVGTTAFLEDSRMFLDRRGYLEESFFTFSFSPIRDETGRVVGLFHPLTETTGNMLGQRRTRTLRDLTAIGLETHSVDEALRRTAQVLTEATLDVPFALCYWIDADRRSARLVARAGLTPGGSASPMLVDLTGEDPAWPLAQVAATGTPSTVNDLRARFPGLICGPYPEPLACACILPIAPPGHGHPLGLMVIGVSTRLPLNEAYTGFHDLLGSTVGSVVASALAAEAERRRVEALAEIDRAKTAFFANISHEFRTPLTLMLGPLEDELAEHTAPLPAARRARLDTAHRNSLRLLKLVNSLLDFSRIEAGRAKASYQATDLAAYTAELASTFRSAIEKAGLTLTVDCPTLPEPVFVDREMWEKVVLNLLSNAFKHTFTGGIRIALRWRGAQVELDVADSGIGISAADLPGLFERFRQVKGARSRTYEGTGIGLSLVQELAKMHGGTVRVASELGKGSTFTVTLKTGRSHLRDEEIATPSALQPSTARVASYVEEALQWIPVAPALPVVATAGAGRGRIVWADDNTDMRDYVQRLLSTHYDVTAVGTGTEAVAAALSAPPDLVLTDIMMPGLDGYGVLRALRADERTRLIPVILLSARAGEEAVVDGTDMGADDYLVKPFAARELLARVRTHIGLAKLRREWQASQARAAALERDTTESRKLLAATTESRRALLGILEDQQRAEAARRASEQTLQRTLDAAHIGYWDLDLATHAASRSLRHDQIFGYSEMLTDWTYEKFLTHVHPEDSERVDRLFQAGVAAKTEWDFECRIIRTDGALRWIWVHGNVFANTADEPVRMLGMVSDITGRKLAEEERRQSEEKFSRVFHLGPAGMTITRVADGKFLDVNESFLRLFERSRKEAIGHTSLELNMLSPDERDRLMQRQRESGGLHNAELLARAKSGRLLNLLFSSKPIEVDGEHCLVTTLIDITERKQVETELREANQRATYILETMSDAFVTWDKNWLYTHVNAAAERTLGRRREEMLGRNILDLFHPDPEDPARLHYEHAMTERVPVSFEIFYPPLQIWTEVRVYPTADGGLSLFFRDITERIQQLEALRESEARLNEAQHSAHVGSWRFVPPATFIWSDEMYELFKLPREVPVTYEAIVARIHPEDNAGRYNRAFERALASYATDFRAEYRIVWPDGQVREVISLGKIRREADGRLIEAVGTLQDVTASKLAEQALRENTRQLEILSRRLLAAQETERRHIAHELHDEIGQLLTVVKLDLQSVLRQPKTTALAPALKESMESIDRVVARVRDLSLDLRPSMLDDLGLLPTLRWYVQRQVKHLDAGVDIALSLPPSLPRLPGTIETACFRVAQEALTNVARHAGAQRIEVTLAAEGHNIELTVHDNGAGFDVAAARRLALSGAGIGLLGMQERAELAGGQLTIVSAPGQGTTVRARFPGTAASGPAA